MATRLFLLIVLFAVSGCAEGSSVYHNRPLPAAGGRIITIDAKQRNLLVTRDDTNNWRICAEAAPDVFSALSASASLEADVKSQSGRAAAAIAESASTIERTQTVNLLRESMYRTCERYLSGSIGRGQLVVQAARDQRAMVKILAIEQLTRAARPPATIIAAPSTSAMTINGDAGARLIEDAAKERAAAKVALDGATTGYATALKSGKCEAVSTAPAEDSADPKLADWTTCKAAAATKAARQSDYDSATTRFDKILGSVGQLGSQTGATTGGGTAQAGGGNTGPSDVVLASIASSVATIVAAPDIDEVLMFCIAYLDTGAQPLDKAGTPVAALLPDPDTANRCRTVLVQRAAKDEQIRNDLVDFNGTKTTFVDGSKPIKDALATLQNYISKPRGADATAKAERKRRIGLAQSAAAKLGLAAKPSDIAILTTEGKSEIVALLIRDLRNAETHDNGLADLQ